MRIPMQAIPEPEFSPQFHQYAQLTRSKRVIGGASSILSNGFGLAPWDAKPQQSAALSETDKRYRRKRQRRGDQYDNWNHWCRQHRTGDCETARPRTNSGL